MLDFLLLRSLGKLSCFCISEGERKFYFSLLISFPILMMFITLSSVIFWLVLVNCVSVCLVESSCWFYISILYSDMF